MSLKQEKRAVERRRILKAGSIVFGGSAIDCVVRNMSEAGAALDVNSPVGIPTEFMLIHGADRDQRQCTVVWRSKTRIGVVFSAD
jgi:PilZ domain